MTDDKPAYAGRSEVSERIGDFASAANTAEVKPFVTDYSVTGLMGCRLSVWICWLTALGTVRAPRGRFGVVASVIRLDAATSRREF
jgi:hypothetical protein